MITVFSGVSFGQLGWSLRSSRSQCIGAVRRRKQMMDPGPPRPSLPRDRRPLAFGLIAMYGCKLAKETDVDPGPYAKAALESDRP